MCSENGILNCLHYVVRTNNSVKWTKERTIANNSNKNNSGYEQKKCKHEKNTQTINISSSNNSSTYSMVTCWRQLRPINIQELTDAKNSLPCSLDFYSVDFVLKVQSWNQVMLTIFVWSARMNEWIDGKNRTCCTPRKNTMKFYNENSWWIQFHCDMAAAVLYKINTVDRFLLKRAVIFKWNWRIH